VPPGDLLFKHLMNCITTSRRSAALAVDDRRMGQAWRLQYSNAILVYLAS
jgi:hypothetical protein